MLCIFTIIYLNPNLSQEWSGIYLEYLPVDNGYGVYLGVMGVQYVIGVPTYLCNVGM